MSDGSFVPNDEEPENNIATSSILNEEQNEDENKTNGENFGSFVPTDPDHDDSYISRAQTDIKKAETIDLDTRTTNSNESDQILYIDANNLEILNKIGEGANGIIYLSRLGDELVAVKEEIGTSEEKKNKIEKELGKVVDLDHENIIRVYGKCASIEKCDWIVMEYAETSLESFLKDTKQALINKNCTPVKIPDSICLKMILQLASALKAAHSKDHIHADLSSRNVLIKKRPSDFLELNGIVLKIIDFSDETKTKGTPSYMAPELVRGLVENPTKECDVYSFGVLCHEILTLETPFEKIKNEMDYYPAMLYIHNFHESENRFSFKDYPECPKKIAEIISECFNTAQQRPTFSDLIRRLEELILEYPDEDYYDDEQEWDNNEEIIFVSALYLIFLYLISARGVVGCSVDSGPVNRSSNPACD